MPQQEMRSIVLRTLGETAPEVDPDEIDPNVAFADQFDFDSVNCLDFVLALGGNCKWRSLSGTAPS